VIGHRSVSTSAFVFEADVRRAGVGGLGVMLLAVCLASGVSALIGLFWDRLPVSRPFTVTRFGHKIASENELLNPR
jgi:hypothetical protein